MGGVWCCGLGATRFALGAGGNAFPRELSPSVFPLTSFHRRSGAQGADPSQPRNLPRGICADTHPGQGWRNDPIRLFPFLRCQLSTQHWCLCLGAALRLGRSGGSGVDGGIDVPGTAAVDVCCNRPHRYRHFAAPLASAQLDWKAAAGSSVVGHVANLVATVRFLLSGRRVAVAAPLSLMACMAQGVSLYLIVHALGYELTASTVAAIYCLSILAGAASFSPGGLGPLSYCFCRRQALVRRMP